MKEKALKFLGLGSAAILTDYILSNILYYTFDWSLTLCGMIGFAAGSLVAYFIHLNVTFATRNLSFTWKSLYRFFKTSIAAAILRVIALFVLDWFTTLYGFVTLLLSILISSAVRFLLSSFYVFRQPTLIDDLQEQIPSDREIPLSESSLGERMKDMMTFWKSR